MESSVDTSSLREMARVSKSRSHGSVHLRQYLVYLVLLLTTGFCAGLSYSILRPHKILLWEARAAVVAEDWQRAISLISQAEELSPLSESDLKLLTHSYFQLKDFRNAARTSEHLARLHPADTYLAQQLGGALYAAGDLKEAQQVFLRLLFDAPTTLTSLQNHEVVLQLLRIYEQERRPHDALRLLQTFPLPDADEVLQIKAGLLEQVGDLEGARALARQILERHPQDIVANRIMAYELMQKGLFEAAETHLSRIVNERSSPSLKLALIEVCLAQGKLDTAWEWMSTIPTEATPDDILEKKADILTTREAPREAAEILQQLLAKHPDHDLVRLKYARLLRWLGSSSEAVRHYELLLARNPSDVLLRREFATTLEENGDRTRAQRELRAAIAASSRGPQ